MSEPGPTPAQMREQLERLRRLDSKATPAPWAWESIAEKSNEFAVGQAFDANGQPIAGRIEPDPDTIMDDTVIERRGLVGMNESGHANFVDAELICELRNALPLLLDASAALLQRAEQAEKRVQNLLFDLNLIGAQLGISKREEIEGAVNRALLAISARVDEQRQRAEQAEAVIAKVRQWAQQQIDDPGLVTFAAREVLDLLKRRSTP
jgi:hypothetical protein